MNLHSLLKKYKELIFLLLMPSLVFAAIVTAAQVAQAILNSPNASSQLKQYANAIGNLAVNVESSGNTQAYNGSCCYGILQMTTSNIQYYAQMTPAQYQQLSLQDQVNYWAQLTSPLLNSSAVKQLTNMGTFDGQTVNGDMVLACVQLGTGNCQKMINSGSCSGFADKNGTTICSMADKIDGGTSSTVTTPTNPGTGNSGSSTGPTWTEPACLKDASGCLTPGDAMAQAFQTGSGMSMTALKHFIEGIVVAVLILILMLNIKDAWVLYSKGSILQQQLVMLTLKNGMSISMILLLMTYMG